MSSKELIEFRQSLRHHVLDIYDHPLLYENIKCLECSPLKKKECTLYSAEKQGWWIDDFFFEDREQSTLADLCFECRTNSQIKNSKGSEQCSRCTRFGEFAENVVKIRSDETDKLVLAYSNGIDCIFCYSCYSKIRYL